MLKSSYARRSWSILLIFPPMKTRILQSFHLFLLVSRYGISKVRPDKRQQRWQLQPSACLSPVHHPSTWQDRAVASPSPPSSNSHHTSTVPFPCLFWNCWLASSSLWSDTFRGTVGLFLSVTEKQKLLQEEISVSWRSFTSSQLTRSDQFLIPVKQAVAKYGCKELLLKD